MFQAKTAMIQEAGIWRGTVDTALPQINAKEFELFRSLVHQKTGIWLRDGKEVMLASRLARRLRNLGLSSFSEYYQHIEHAPADSEEVRQFINCVTTNKTSFFREPHHFEYLANTIAPEFRTARASGKAHTFRVWSAACSTGEEPYSIAMTLLDCLPDVSSSAIEIVASDIDTNVLSTASRAIYRDECLECVDPVQRKKYFLRGKDDMRGHVKIKPEARQRVQFKRINLIDSTWPIEGAFDVIFFRNALIYFQPDTQDVFLRKMARLLKPNGHLFLGNSEHIPRLYDIFMPLRQTMYRLRRPLK